MKAFKWEPVDTNTGTNSILEPGGYVCRITGVEDKENASSPHLVITWDVAEGAHAGHYSDEWGQTNEWAHQARWYYTEKSMWRFNKNLAALGESNPGFDPETFAANPNAKSLIGLTFGAVIQKRFYTNSAGEDKEALEITDVVSAAAIRANDFKLPEPRDQRTVKTAAPAPQASSFDDIPF